MLSEGPIGLGEVAGCGTRCDTRQANTDIVREFGVVVIDAARQHEASAERSFPLKLDAFALRSRGILHRVADQYRIEDRFLQPFIFVVIADETELQPTIEQPELGTDLPDLDLFGADDQRIGVGSRRRLRVDIVSDRKSTRLNSSHYCASRLPFSA